MSLIYVDKWALYMWTKEPYICGPKSPMYVDKRALYICGQKSLIFTCEQTSLTYRQRILIYVDKRALYMWTKEPYVCGQKSQIYMCVYVYMYAYKYIWKNLINIHTYEYTYIYIYKLTCETPYEYTYIYIYINWPVKLRGASLTGCRCSKANVSSISGSPSPSTRRTTLFSNSSPSADWDVSQISPSYLSISVSTCGKTQNKFENGT